MNKEKIKILIWGAIIFTIGFVVIDFVINYNEEVNIVEQANEQTQQTEVSGNGLENGINIGDLAYDFELQDMDGNFVKLSDFRGKKVFLNFWASWCPPCRAEAPHLKDFHDNNDLNTVVLGVNVTSSESKIENVEAFIEEFDLGFTNLYESDGVSYLYEAMSLPTSYFIDSNGVIRNIAVGAVNADILEEEFSKIE